MIALAIAGISTAAIAAVLIEFILLEKPSDRPHLQIGKTRVPRIDGRPRRGQ